MLLQNHKSGKFKKNKRLNGEPTVITDGRKIRTFLHGIAGGQSKLFCFLKTFLDFGNYSCRAENSLGKNWKQVEVTVRPVINGLTAAVQTN